MGGVIVCVAFSFIFLCFIFNLIHATSARRGTAEFQQSANDRDGKVCSMWIDDEYANSSKLFYCDCVCASNLTHKTIMIFIFNINNKYLLQLHVQ